jgi:hypothetical protein
MEEKNNTLPATVEPEMQSTAVDDNADWNPHASKLVRFYCHPWTQIILLSFIFFCLPGVRTFLLNVLFPVDLV